MLQCQSNETLRTMNAKWGVAGSSSANIELAGFKCSDNWVTFADPSQVGLLQIKPQPCEADIDWKLGLPIWTHLKRLYASVCDYTLTALLHTSTLKCKLHSLQNQCVQNGFILTHSMPLIQRAYIRVYVYSLCVSRAGNRHSNQDDTELPKMDLTKFL